MPSSLNFWNDLFPAIPAGEASIIVEGRVLSKKGRPFLLLPKSRKASLAALTLYPAQSRRARAAGALFRALLKLSVMPWAKKVAFAISKEDPYLTFLQKLAGAPLVRTPGLGILAGNPRSEGQRFMVLVFGPDAKPIAVAKTGLTERAKDLILKEQALLSATDACLPGIPRLLASFEDARLRSFGLAYIWGHPPRHRDYGTVPRLLGAWLSRDQTIALRQTEDWRRLEKVCSGHPALAKASLQVRDCIVPSTLTHGDFAPWNIRVRPDGDWCVLDWERGELMGVPGWDWFHYVIQPAILVKHLNTRSLLEEIQKLLNSAQFQAYADKAGIRGLEQHLLLAYLLHRAEVIRPAEGLEQTRALLEGMLARMKPSGSTW